MMAEALRLPRAPLTEDGAVVGIDTDGCILQDDDGSHGVYNCGETLEQFGLHNLRDSEKDALLLALYHRVFRKE